MSTRSDLQFSDDYGPQPVASEANPRPSLTSESVLASGAWRARAAARTEPSMPEQAEALEWQPQLSLRQRITRAISVPAAAGAAVFVVAVIIAIAVAMFQGGGAIDASAASPSGKARTDTAEAAASVVGSVSKPGGAGAGATAGAGTGAGDAKGGTQRKSEKFLVHVVGEVAKPGVVELAAGDRVADAIARAGGATPQAALQALNLARAVTDGEQLLVPNAEQAASAPPPADVPAGSGDPGSEVGAPGALVNLNTADTTLLQTLPRIGPALAQRILDWRQSNGSFVSVDQLMEVSGVGAKTFEGLREKVTV